MKSKVTAFGILALMLLFMTSCINLRNSPMQGGKQIHVGQGTEDIVLDSWSESPRLLISCADRRHGDEPTFGAIVSYDPKTELIDTLTINEYPVGLAFRPHGLDIIEINDHVHLYVVCHDPKEGNHWIANFRVEGKELYWIRNYYAGMLPSPNAVCAMPDGSLYVNNDHFEHDNNSEVLWKKQVAEIVRFEQDGSHKVAYKGMAYGNGITFRDSVIYAASTRRNAIYSFDIAPNGDLLNRTKIAKLKGPDNLRWDGDDLIVACHVKPLKFLKHVKNAEKLSPSVIYRIKLGEKKPILMYADKGKNIPACATGLIYDGKLYIGQVFEDWILEVTE